ncbi:CueP family metal-binding protein [Agrococcus sp. TF02-05]|uniref:CueP family metal-binding protein n=1 Tax=Agrococcus sp. TF02-05 TaxID=2815211 RepID=UPI001AA1C84C|nr:CueP family metal-binding protein [Agrococcus sp. TF02-05]MBO1770071.1 CueP family metal-binding protein [Agrococcus sp. TF02-05]
MRSRRSLTALAAVGIAVLAGCTAVPAPQDAAASSATDDVLADHGLAGLTAVEVIDVLDRVAVSERSTTLIASVRPDALVLEDERGETSLPLPDDLAYVSIAPYVEQTHECHFHSLTTCQGELSREPVRVTITDASGAVIVDESTQTFDNGFVGYWLPRDLRGSIEIEHAGMMGVATLSTSADAPTCITTLALR